MKLQIWIPVLLASALALASCGDSQQEIGPPVPMDAQPDASPADAGIDAPPPDSGVEPPLPDLTAICGGQPKTFAEWELCYRRRWCEWRVGCLPMNSYSDMQECMERGDDVEEGRLEIEHRERQRAVDLGRVEIDKTAFARCLLDTSASQCNTARYSVACASRFKTIVNRNSDAGSCYIDAECRSPGATCEANCADACCLGTCKPKLKLGQPCELEDSCEPGLVCNQTCQSGDVGAACTTFLDCDSSAWCDAGRCKADLAPGAPCTGRSQCGGQTSCIGYSIVSGRPGSCKSISRPGDACELICYGGLTCTAGTCRELPELGGTCSAFAPCSGVDNVCVGGVCVTRRAETATCSDEHPCLPGLFCTSEVGAPDPVCSAPRGLDAVCSKPSHCESRVCSSVAGETGVCLPWRGTCPSDAL
jgi:hypothetical protein